MSEASKIFALNSPHNGISEANPSLSAKQKPK
jgi:hypothetical protein